MVNKLTHNEARSKQCAFRSMGGCLVHECMFWQEAAVGDMKSYGYCTIKEGMNEIIKSGGDIDVLE
jgi:hypothetical protein